MTPEIKFSVICLLLAIAVRMIYVINHNYEQQPGNNLFPHGKGIDFLPIPDIERQDGFY